MNKKKVIPYEYIPDIESETITIEGKDYLVANDAMFTFYKRSKGELSPFFLAIRDAVGVAMGLQIAEAPDVRPAEAIDCLVIITHHGESTIGIAQPVGMQQELDRVAVLELVHEHVPELPNQ